MGGGVFVKDNASFVLNEGKVIKNKAGAGGGVFIWTNCGFTMNGGKISHNETIDPDGDGPALAHEGGGIFTNGKKAISSQEKLLTILLRLLQTGAAAGYMLTTMVHC